MYQNKLLSDKYYLELPELSKIQLADKLKIKEDLKNARAATLFHILQVRCNAVREHAENILQGSLDPDIQKAMWLMLRSFDGYQMKPAELK